MTRSPWRVLAQRVARNAEPIWVSLVVVYTIVRLIVAWQGFAEHGANPWIFGLLDVGGAYPYAKATAALARRAAHAEWNKLAAPLSIAVVMFFAPYVYLWFAAGEMPADLRAGLVSFVVVMVVATVVSLAGKIRRLRAELHVDDTPIDLTEPIDVIEQTRPVEQLIP